MAKPIFEWGKEFDIYLNDCSRKDAAKMAERIQAIEINGLAVAAQQKWIKKLDNNLYEIRARTNEHFMRGIYFQVKLNKYFIVRGFNKKTNITPYKEIKKAKYLKDKYLRGEDNVQN